MQLLYKIIKSPETSGSETISLPDIKLMYEKNKQAKQDKQDKLDTSDSNPDKSSEIYAEIVLSAKKKAEMIIKEAEVSSKKILEDSKASSRKILEDSKKAAEKALNAAKDEGYQQGYRQGYNEGYQFGINEANSEADEIRKNADIYIESCKNETEAYIKNKHEEILQLSITIAKQIIKSELIVNPEIVNKIAEQVLSQATDRKHVVLKVNPADFNVVKNKKDDLSIYVENPNNLFIIADSSVTQGSIKAETASGFIDGDIATQLDMISKILLRN